MMILIYNADFSAEPPMQIVINYFAPLSEVLEQFNRETQYGIHKFYNKYGQELPLSYRVQKTGLDIYYRKPRHMIPVSSDEEEEWDSEKWGPEGIDSDFEN